MGSTAVGVQRTGEVIVGRRWGVATCAMHSCTAGSASRGGTTEQLGAAFRKRALQG